MGDQRAGWLAELRRGWTELAPLRWALRSTGGTHIRGVRVLASGRVERCSVARAEAHLVPARPPHASGDVNDLEAQ